MQQPLRILHVMRAPVGGLFRHVLDLAGEQAKRGHYVGLVADRNAADSLTSEKLSAIAPHLKLGLSLIPMSRRPGLGDISAIRAVRTVARALDLDVLHGHGAKGGAYARLARPFLPRTRVRVFYTPHGGSLHYKPGTVTGTLFSVLERMMGRLTDGLIFESDFARRAYVRLAGEGGAPRRVIPNGLQPRDFTEIPTAPDAADFLFIGELRVLKGVDELLKALAEVMGNRPVRAVIVGAGPDGDAFKAEAARLGLSSHVTFPGAMPAEAAFPLGRALVVPSRAESFPYIVLEAGAAGKPLIATSVGGIPEIVAGTQTALIPPCSVPDLVRAMEALLDDPEGARGRANELRAAVQCRFTVRAMTDAVLDFYRSA
ncbi:glycosyltransferase family 4 protein [Hyphomicrobium sp.]|uniref:glycosyltransferase family 4 protein n=1 Tax=Hyphomicrobium sp. TaxID=82 RepID=UPI002C20B53D|nr:glycosyltransferase family 4 protein [Hyphomicrobium sp.]HRN88474.1 glycosyltransferase family 4 protein [Hyphomicrobium sp.]HRQ25565.1 glycosyltransferase family 4 protein [Hyphomicrobium sp.]